MSRAEFRIDELLYERSFHLLLIQILGTEGPGDDVFEDREDGQSLYPLRSPIGPYLTRVDTPDFLCVVLEEHLVQRTAEAVDIEVLQGGFRQLVHQRDHVSEACTEGVFEAHARESAPFDGDGIIEEGLEEEDAGNALTNQHHAVFLFGVRPAGRQGFVLLQENVVHGRGALHGHHFLPPLHHFFILGEEAMATDIHPVAFVPDGLRDAANDGSLFQDDGMDVRMPEQFPGGGKAGRTGAGDDGSLHRLRFE